MGLGVWHLPVVGAGQCALQAGTTLERCETGCLQTGKHGFVQRRLWAHSQLFHRSGPAVIFFYDDKTDYLIHHNSFLTS